MNEQYYEIDLLEIVKRIKRKVVAYITVRNNFIFHFILYYNANDYTNLSSEINIVHW